MDWEGVIGLGLFCLYDLRDEYICSIAMIVLLRVHTCLSLTVKNEDLKPGLASSSTSLAVALF